MSMFPTPLTAEESRAKFDDYVAFLKAKGMEHHQALEGAVAMHEAWHRGELRRRLPTFEYRVVYRRRGWTQVQARLYQRKGAAEAFMHKLRRVHPHYEPLVEIRLEQRRVESVWWPIIDEDLTR